VSGLDEVVDEGGLGFAFSNPFGVASRAFLHGRNSGKGAVLAKRVAFIAIGEARLLRVRFVAKLEGLLFLHVEQTRKSNPPRQQRNGEAESEHDRIP